MAPVTGLSCWGIRGSVSQHQGGRAYMEDYSSIDVDNDKHEVLEHSFLLSPAYAVHSIYLSFLYQILNQILSFLYQILNQILSFLYQILNQILSFLYQILNQILSFLYQILNQILSFLYQILNQILSFLYQILNQILSFLNQILSFSLYILKYRYYLGITNYYQTYQLSELPPTKTLTQNRTLVIPISGSSEVVPSLSLSLSLSFSLSFSLLPCYLSLQHRRRVLLCTTDTGDRMQRNSVSGTCGTTSENKSNFTGWHSMHTRALHVYTCRNYILNNCTAMRRIGSEKQ